MRRAENKKQRGEALLLPAEPQAHLLWAGYHVRGNLIYLCIAAGTESTGQGATAATL
jgi:hypothetical protein